MSKFRYLENITTADLAFEAYGADYDELLENAGLALESAQVDLESLEQSRVYKIELKANSLESLLHTFLEELVFLKDAKQLLFNRIKCDVNKERSDLWVVSCDLSGEKIDKKKHKLGVDVKAVTKHLFKIERLPNKDLRCQIVLDV